MKMLITVLVGVVVFSGWVHAAQIELADHFQSAVGLQLMDDNSCSTSSSSGAQ